MSLSAHLVWVAVVVVLGIAAIVSLWSDVWEVYVSAFVVSSAVHGATWWRARRR